MGIKLAVLEPGLWVLGICVTVLFWVRSPLLDWVDVATYLGQGLLLALSCVVSFYYNDLYDLRKVRSFVEFTVRLVQSLGISFILIAAIYTLIPDLRLANGPFLTSLVFPTALVLVLRGALYASLKAHAFGERVLILGRGPLASKIATEMGAASHLGYSIVGFVDDGSPSHGSFHAHSAILRELENLEQTVEELRPDRIVVALAERRGHLPMHLLLKMRMNGILVEDGIELYERLAGKLAVERLNPSYLIFSRDFEQPRWQMAFHRVTSLAGAALGMLLTLPLMGIIALLIKRDSKGPVLFIQERLGRRGQVFGLMKFRTMHLVDQAASEWVRDNSTRITRVGKWLRKFRLDELPQFVNILRGDMDLVGPRPHPASNFHLFVEKIPYYSLRHMVRPGITGWAQVRYGYANDLEEETEKIRYDLYYIKHMSVWLDLRILFDTVKIVLFGRGSKEPDAYGATSLLEVGKK